MHGKSEFYMHFMCVLYALYLHFIYKIVRNLSAFYMHFICKMGRNLYAFYMHFIRILYTKWAELYLPFICIFSSNGPKQTKEAKGRAKNFHFAYETHNTLSQNIY